MRINIKATNMDLTFAIEENIKNRISSINKFLNNNDAILKIEVGKTTNHHNKGDIYRAEIDISSGEEKYYASFEGEDLYNSINQVKDQILREIKDKRGKKQTLFKRGAISIKKRIKGILSYKR